VAEAPEPFVKKGAVMQPNRTLSFTAALVIATSIAGSPTSVSANTHVVRPGESIQDAVDAAASGDTVLVKAGTYHEFVTIRTDGLTLQAHGVVTLKPPYHGYSECYIPGHDVGICVVPVDFNPATGSYTNRVRDVTISGFRIVGFAGEGVFGFGTKNLKVSHVIAVDNSAYGLASFDGIGTTFTRNAVTGSHDAGLYIGDSLEANAVVSYNRAWGNAFGILARHSRKVVVSNNESWSNCIGVFLLADGQAGGSGETAVLNNNVWANNEVCTQFADVGFLPVLGGGGIVLAGSQHNAVFQNTVKDNQGDTLFSGGLVVVATPRASADGTFDASTNNLVLLNTARGNAPADIVKDAASMPNLIIANRCQTSVPDGLCK
jgi:hypothetical protein